MGHADAVGSEPVPDHTTLVRHMQTIPGNRLDLTVSETAHRCIDKAGGVAGPLGADSSAVETTRYADVEKPDANECDFIEKIQRIYWKYHITAILGLQIILAAFSTPGNVSDTAMFPTMLAEIRHRGFDLAGCVFDCDKGYDSDYNCRLIFEMSMTPNIKQRKDAVSRGKPHRKKATGLFDGEWYKERSMIEGVLGAEETRRHHLYCRFVRDDNQRRFAKGMTISWNIRVLNQFECAARLNIPIPPYDVAHAGTA